MPASSLEEAPKLAEGLDPSLKDSLIGMTKIQVSKAMRLNGYGRFRAPGETAREASYKNTTGGFPAYVSVYFDSKGTATRVKAS